MLAAMVQAAGEHVFAATTLGQTLDGSPLPTTSTWDGFLANASHAHAQGCRRGVVEITSLALARGHAQRFRFDIGVFTNLSRDHLNVHGSPEAYLAAKAQLFVFLGPGKTAVLNARDPAAAHLDRAIPADVERLWYGVPTRGESHHPEDLGARFVHVSATGTEVELSGDVAAVVGRRINLPLVGHIFAENALAACLAAYAMGLPGEAIVRGLAEMPVVPGRFEVVGQQPLVAIDYAHCAQALHHTCKTARTLTHRGDRGEGPSADTSAGARDQRDAQHDQNIGTHERGRVLLVFGAGGNTDPSKRVPMGEAVGRGADVAIVTSDNPRDEDPLAIATILADACRRVDCPQVEVILSREQAIARALDLATPHDVVVIAGKGHETGQLIAGQTVAFSDHEQVRRWCTHRST